MLTNKMNLNSFCNNKYVYDKQYEIDKNRNNNNNKIGQRERERERERERTRTRKLYFTRIVV